MKILTADEMGATDRVTVERFGVSMAQLMEHAGAAVARFAMSQWPSAKRIVVLAGTGNNGGDGFVAARHLAEAGREVRVLVIGDANKLQGDAAAARSALKSVELMPFDATAEQPLRSADLVIDAVVGTGFKPPLRGEAVQAREMLKQIATPVLSVDLPSGWDADSDAETVEGAFRSDGVVTFTAPKRAHVLSHLTGATFAPVVVAEIGSPDDAIVSESKLVWAGASKAITEKPRAINSNKGKYGHVLIVGGALGKAGAPSMASLACLRAGAGLVTAAVPRSVVGTVAAIAPELMSSPLDEDANGFLSMDAVAQIVKLAESMKVLAIGPGLGTEGDTSEVVRRVIAETKLPVVIDADGLNAFAGKTDLLQAKGRTMVLTPHPGEMARLIGKTVKDVEADRENIARAFAAKHGVTLVLKGWRTLIAHPDGTLAVNTSGNPALAKGGSGDILTGILSAMLGQFPDRVADAVNAGVSLHGVAADFAAHAMDEKTVLATDVIAHLSDAFRYRARDEDGFTWIAGLRMSRLQA